uniref:Secreted protein n=1 Tax=Brassica oleracea TaxID=3712 RepID=A0A3P6EJ42_BRAOL|nr:unnamed protein product [Brassica oleracea]
MFFFFTFSLLLDVSFSSFLSFGKREEKTSKKKKNCWRRRKKFEEDWSSPSSRILSSSIHLRRSPYSP